MGLSPEIRKRLQQLNRELMSFRASHAAKEHADAPAAEAPAEAFVESPSSQAPANPPQRGSDGPVVLEEAVPGTIVSSPLGTLYLVRKSYAQMVPEPGPFLSAFRDVFRGGTMAWREGELHPDLRPLLSIDPQRVLFVDIETTGLSAHPLFLIGTMRFAGADLEVCQMLARDYSEERAIIGHFAGELAGCDVIVTYNGKSFDLPYITNRGIAHGLEVSHGGLHLDLLHEARRRWRGRLPDCRLQTLERHICKRSRAGDIPGEMIPQAYHDFVRTGDACQVCDILHHNALDLIAMGEILLFMIQETEQ